MSAAKQQPIDWASPKQREVFEYGPAPICASGGFGSAKTYALCLKALWLSECFPGNRGVIARKVHEELRLTTMSTFYKICPPQAYSEGRRADSEKYLRLNNGSEVLFLHMDNPETENVIRGIEINWFFCDQAEEMEEEIFDLLMSRLGRWDKAEVPDELVTPEWPWLAQDGRALPPVYPMLACNPDTEMHWIYRRFHPDSPEHWDRRFPSATEPDKFVSYHDLGYKLVTMRSDENKFLPKQNLQQMMQHDDSFVRRFVRGEWGIPEGQIHELLPESILEPEPGFVDYLLNTCSLHRTLDHGDTAPTACLWWAVDREGNAYCYREYYQAGRLISDHRRAISELSGAERYTLNHADPSIHYKTMQKHGGRWSVADEYADVQFLPHETALFWEPGDKDELSVRNRISEHLRIDPDRIHPVTKQKGSPRLFFLKHTPSYPQGCDYAIRELRAQRRKRLGTDMGKPIFSGERDDKIPDHAYDCIRYLVASRPPLATETARRVPARSFEAVRRDYLRWKRRGGQRELARRAARVA